MTNRTYVLLAISAIAGVWAGSACLVDRKSDTIACSGPTDCMAPRVCEDGFCVVDPDACPAQCVTCDMSTTPHVCMVSGTGGSSFTCPDGLKCVIDCSTSDACGNITCAPGSQCDITCSAGSACNDITCNGESCTVKCTAGNACDNVTCGGGNNGRCDLQCTASTACNSAKCLDACSCAMTCSTADACGTILCPKAMGNMYCTESGAQGEPCITTAAMCNKC
jgi:hypothetical protein